MASEYRVMNQNGSFAIQENKGDGIWETLTTVDDINSAKELVRSYRKLK